MKLCFYACKLFACIGYREVMHGGTHWTDCCGLGLTSFPDCHGKPRQGLGMRTTCRVSEFCLPIVLSKPRTEAQEVKLAWKFW